MKYKEFKKPDFPAFEAEMLAFWKENQVFQKSIENRQGARSYVFYEGPPSANGMPGIHHVMARAVKDIFCRYNTMKGFQVQRKAGWDTHGLPVELQVEKALGITKDDIGKKITVAEYNEACRKDVMKYTDIWNRLTERMGYWVDMEHPYITYDNAYIETLWHLLQMLYKKGLLYKGYTIQPYSPAAGTGLSSHELNQPGTYKDVKDHTAVAMFKLTDAADTYILAWTTTPWTLPSNTALAVGEKIEYVKVKTFHPHTHKPVEVILAKALLGKHFPADSAELDWNAYQPGDKKIPYQIVDTFTGKSLEGLRYEQLLPFVPVENGDAFKVILGDFVTTEDGTGIVHIAPSFGADDFRVARQHGIGSLTLVDKRGRFVKEVCDDVFLYGEEYVKEAYLSEEEKAFETTRQKERLQSVIKDTSKLNYLSVDERITLKLQTEGKLFKKEKYEHTYPHCWRTDKPILYYPLESWFIKTTALKDRLVELNKTIQWMPEHTGTGRFGNWLENLVDWNLSRSRYWGTALPIWRTKDGSEEKCIGSIAELNAEIEKSVAAGFMEKGFEVKDLHKPYVDQVILVSEKNEPMHREADLIDVWFDSGAMPYAQWHWPFENADTFDSNFPADFIAEGVDQTRGWFFTLHAISVLLFDQIAFKNVISNGLVLDKNGNKMSKRLGNVVDPFTTIDTYGADATRWYMLSNSDPWDNLKFDLDGVQESQRKFFGTLFNTYSFFAIYANIDGYSYSREKAIPMSERTELDRWISSKLHSLIQHVNTHMDAYDPTPATRAIETFVCDHLSNWYVRLGRRRFWKGEMSPDKQAAYDTLFECLDSISKLMAPAAPFYADWLYRNLHAHQTNAALSVHLTDIPTAQSAVIQTELEEQMEFAQEITSLVLSIRKKENIRVRQPLQKILIPVVDAGIRDKIRHVQNLILSEVNVKELEYIDTIEKHVKPNFKTLGKKLGAKMKEGAVVISGLQAEQLYELEQKNSLFIDIQGERFEINISDVEISTKEIPGYKVAGDGKTTVALDIEISEELRLEGIAREMVSRLQNLRKESGLEVTDRIRVLISDNNFIRTSITHFQSYICSEILADSVELVSSLESGTEVEIDDNLLSIQLIKV